MASLDSIYRDHYDLLHDEYQCYNTRKPIRKSSPEQVDRYSCLLLCIWINIHPRELPHPQNHLYYIENHPQSQAQPAPLPKRPLDRCATMESVETVET